jgi:hypothetical protein
VQLVLLAVIGLRAVAISSQSLWIDESYTALKSAADHTSELVARDAPRQRLGPADAALHALDLGL